MPNLSEYQCEHLDVYQIRHCMAIILKLLASPFECSGSYFSWTSSKLRVIVIH